MEDSEGTVIYLIIRHSLAPVAVIWRARIWNQPVRTIITHWLPTVF